MKCPRCEQGTLIQIQFKRDSKKARICDVCEAFWFQDEIISMNTLHTFDSVSGSEEKEYTVEVSEDRYQEHKSIIYTDIK